MAKKNKNQIESIEDPVIVTHGDFVEYGFTYWLDCLLSGSKPRTLCLLGPPGIGKSSTAYSIQEKMTAYVQENPQVVFGVKTVEEALTLLEADRKLEIETRFFNEVMAGNLSHEDYESRVSFVLSRLDPLLEEAPANASKAEKLEVKRRNKAKLAAFAELIDFSSKLPEDLGGLPFRSADGFTDYCPQRWVAKLCGKYAFGVYVQDDLPAAPQAMQVAGRQAALERRIHENEFADGVLVIVTGNRRQDKASASQLPSHFLNSVTLMAIEPNEAEWRKWYAKQPDADGVVAAFIHWKPDLLSELPGDSNDKLGAFATPRQWFSLGQQFKSAQKVGSHMLLAVASGLIGKANALEFTAFVEIRNTLTPPEEVLDDPKGALPKPAEELDEPSKQIAMVMALAEHAAQRWTRGSGATKTDAPVKLFKAIAHVTAAVGDEFAAVGVQTFLDGGGDLTALARVAQHASTDADIGRLMDHVKKAVLGVGDDDESVPVGSRV